jgi:hypothetical protein
MRVVQVMQEDVRSKIRQIMTDLLQKASHGTPIELMVRDADKYKDRYGTL